MKLPKALRLVLAAAAAALPASVLATTATGTTASAWCYTHNDPRNWDEGSPTWGHEQPGNGTCDDLGDYEGGIYDYGVGDGACAAIRTYINGSYQTPYEYSCYTYGNGFTFNDSNHYTPMWVCKSSTSGTGLYSCSAQIDSSGF